MRLARGESATRSARSVLQHMGLVNAVTLGSGSNDFLEAEAAVAALASTVSRGVCHIHRALHWKSRRLGSAAQTATPGCLVNILEPRSLEPPSTNRPARDRYLLPFYVGFADCRTAPGRAEAL